jgi:hypothetical protein
MEGRRREKERECDGSIRYEVNQGEREMNGRAETNMIMNQEGEKEKCKVTN